jgi:hypothetical protein
MTRRRRDSKAADPNLVYTGTVCQGAWIFSISDPSGVQLGNTVQMKIGKKRNIFAPMLPYLIGQIQIQ